MISLLQTFFQVVLALTILHTLCCVYYEYSLFEDEYHKRKATSSSIQAWRSPWTVHGLTTSLKWLSDFHFHYSFFKLDAPPRISLEKVSSLESHKGNPPTPTLPLPCPGQPSSPIVTDTGICLRTIWPACYANDIPTEGAHGQIAISRPHVGLLLFLKTAHSATAGN